LSGYILEPSAAPAPIRMVKVWGYVVVVTEALGEPEAGTTASVFPVAGGGHPGPRPIRPPGQPLPIAATPAAVAPPAVRTLRPVRSGGAYRIVSSAVRGLVTPELAEALETVFERFAHQAGFVPERPLEIRLGRGFQAGSHGHGEGRAVDIVAVGGKELRTWKAEWEAAAAAGNEPTDAEPTAVVAEARKRSLGYALYQALQEYGGWRVNPGGWRPYRGVMQLFGPWTASEGPWKAMQIQNPNPYQRLRMADQQWVFQAHEDHIHVAR
jgi:hypothetical protein